MGLCREPEEEEGCGALPHQNSLFPSPCQLALLQHVIRLKRALKFPLLTARKPRALYKLRCLVSSPCGGLWGDEGLWGQPRDCSSLDGCSGTVVVKAAGKGGSDGVFHSAQQVLTPPGQDETAPSHQNILAGVCWKAVGGTPWMKALDGEYCNRFCVSLYPGDAAHSPKRSYSLGCVSAGGELSFVGSLCLGEATQGDPGQTECHLLVLGTLSLLM